MQAQQQPLAKFLDGLLLSLQIGVFRALRKNWTPLGGLLCGFIVRFLLLF